MSTSTEEFNLEAVVNSPNTTPCDIIEGETESVNSSEYIDSEDLLDALSDSADIRTLCAFSPKLGVLIGNLVKVITDQKSKIDLLENRVSELGNSDLKREANIKSLGRCLNTLDNKVAYLDNDVQAFAIKVKESSSDLVTKTIASMKTQLQDFEDAVSLVKPSQGGSTTEMARMIVDLQRQVKDSTFSLKVVPRLEHAVKKQDNDILGIMRQMQNYNKLYQTIDRKMATKEQLEKNVSMLHDRIVALPTKQDMDNAISSTNKGNYRYKNNPNTLESNIIGSAAIHAPFKCLTCDRQTPSINGPQQSRHAKTGESNDLLFSNSRKQVALFTRDGVGVFRGASQVALWNATSTMIGRPRSTLPDQKNINLVMKRPKTAGPRIGIRASDSNTANTENGSTDEKEDNDVTTEAPSDLPTLVNTTV